MTFGRTAARRPTLSPRIRGESQAGRAVLGAADDELPAAPVAIVSVADVDFDTGRLTEPRRRRACARRFFTPLLNP